MTHSPISAYLARIGGKGGKTKSPAKARAARRNGKKGGRPSKSSNTLALE